MDPRERLRMALLGSGCTRCGEPYVAHGIRVLAQREQIAFVQLVCYACQTETLTLVMGAPAPDADATGPGESVVDAHPAGDRDGERRAAGPTHQPITESDVLEMRAYLAGYRGDVRGLLGGPADEGETGRGDDDETGTPG